MGVTKTSRAFRVSLPEGPRVRFTLYRENAPGRRHVLTWRGKSNMAAGWVARLHRRFLGDGVPAARAQPVLHTLPVAIVSLNEPKAPIFAVPGF